MSAEQNPYKVLGVASSAPLAEIKKAWHVFARENHPDKTNNDPKAEVRFKAGSDAWRLLSDPALRAEYDEKPAECAMCEMRPATVGFDLCFMCALRVLHSSAAQGAAPEPKRGRPRPREPAVSPERMRRSPDDYMPGRGSAPSSNDLLGALLGEGAIRAARAQSRVDVRVHVTGDPNHADFVRQVTSNLRLANRIVSPLYKWWIGSG